MTDPFIAMGVETIRTESSSRNIRVKSSRLDAYRVHLVFSREGGSEQQNIDVAVSNDFLAAISSSMKESHAVQQFLNEIRIALESHSPTDFLSSRLIPFHVEYEWPVERYGNTTSICLRVKVTDLRGSGQVANALALSSYRDEQEYFKTDPFRRIWECANSMRLAIDEDQLRFYPPDEHPEQLQEVKLRVGAAVKSIIDIEEFLKAKVYWLGFKRHDASTPVWLDNPWDATYLKTSTVQLGQAAQVLEAHEMIRIVRNPPVLGVPGKELLRSFHRPTPTRTSPSLGQDFSFVRESGLRSLIERDYAELNRVKATGAIKSRFTLAGGLIEALLLDALLGRSVEATATAAGKKENRSLNRWGLATLLDAAQELNVVSAGVQKFGHVVREYRNLIHPGLEWKSTLKVEEHEADIAESLLKMVIRDLSS
jgi:hypothetical protein